MKNNKKAEKKITIGEQFSNLGYAFRFLWNINKKLFILRTPLILLKTLQVLVPIYFIRLILNELTSGRDIRNVILFASIMAVSSFFINCLFTLLDRFDTIELSKLETATREHLAESIMGLSYSSLEDAEMQDLQWLASKNRFDAVLNYTSDLVSSLITLISVSTLIMMLNPLIFAFIITGSVLRLFIDRSKGTLSRRYNYERARKTRINEYYKGLMNIPDFGEEIRVSNLENWIYDKTESSWRDDLLPMDRAFHKTRLLYQDLIAFISVFQNIAVYGILAVQVVKSTMTVGDFSMYLTAASTFSSAITQLIQNYSKLITDTSEYLHDYRRCLSNVEKQQKVEIGNTYDELLPENIRIEFKNVSFKYPKTERIILKNINITIESGESLSIIGPNGSGKTTFIKLLCRFYEPTEGEILVNGRSAGDIPLTQYYSYLSAVFQDYSLFEFSVFENIAMDTELDYNRMANCVSMSGLKSRIDTLPHGGNTNLYKNLYPDGIELSEGEGQKLAVARAIYRKTPVVIFDEPTSSLDPIAEYEIYHRFHCLSENRTVIYVSHRLSSTRFTDNTAVFMDGSIVEFGSHEELMKKSGIYKNMFDMQAQYYK